MSQERIYELLKKGKRLTFDEIKNTLKITKSSCYQNLKRLVKRDEVKKELVQTYPDRTDNFRAVYWVDTD